MHDDISAIEKYLRAANYVSAAQIYLQGNYLLREKLSPDDIKPRLLGHWGTCPGINFIYAHLNRLIKKTGAEMLFVLGPGHGFPGLQANLFIEGTLEHYYPQATRDLRGLSYVVKHFSWPYGFPSHVNPGAPGAILEGGELGYSLSTAYGAILDNPNLIAAVVVGDGEAETGPLAAAWNLHHLTRAKENGAVLPILHLNGYKISAPTIFGRMTNKELKSLFYGYGYMPIIVEDGKIHEKMIAALDEAYEKIRAIKSSGDTAKARPPMIILKTPKGWTGIKKLGGEKIEGNCLSHQVPAPQAKTDKKQMNAVEKWLRFYDFSEIFDEKNGFDREILNIVPEENKRMGENGHAFGGRGSAKNLIVPKPEEFSVKIGKLGEKTASSMKAAGAYLGEVFRINAESKNFRMMSPDETYSNKLDEIFKNTARAWNLPVKEWDKDLSPSGRVMEILSEHSLQGLAQGYILTGRYSVFASYEAFIQIAASMVDQYAKFIRVAREFPWREKTPSLNFILTSSGWRQDHNGFSHQNPGFIGDIMQKHTGLAKVFFPADANGTLAVLEQILPSKGGINVLVAGKTDEPQWLSLEAARKELSMGLSIWDFASQENPDIVLCGTGDYLTKETLAAIDIARKESPEIKTRFVNITELSALGIGNPDRTISRRIFEEYFTKNKPVIFNFHGYPETIKEILFDYLPAPQDARQAGRTAETVFLSTDT